jgi:hypothetical protein
MAGVTQKPRARLSRRSGLIALVSAGVLVTVYVFVAVNLQPLGAGPDETLYRAPGQTTVSDPAMASQIEAADPGRQPILLSYVDGAEAALVKTLYNDGPTPITITGVETSPSYLTGALVTLKEAQPAAIGGQPPCSLLAVEQGAAVLNTCQLNEAATWIGGGFRPIQVNPGKEGVVAVHLLMSDCEDNGPGGAYQIIDSIQVHYEVLGFPHVQAVDVGPYWFQSPDTCPRSGPARP